MCFLFWLVTQTLIYGNWFAIHDQPKGSVLARLMYLVLWENFPTAPRKFQINPKTHLLGTKADSHCTQAALHHPKAIVRDDNVNCFSAVPQVESEGAVDDTSMNGIELICRNPVDVGREGHPPRKEAREFSITSNYDSWGEWRGEARRDLLWLQCK